MFCLCIRKVNFKKIKKLFLYKLSTVVLMSEEKELKRRSTCFVYVCVIGRKK